MDKIISIESITQDSDIISTLNESKLTNGLYRSSEKYSMV